MRSWRLKSPSNENGRQQCLSPFWLKCSVSPLPCDRYRKHLLVPWAALAAQTQDRDISDAGARHSGDPYSDTSGAYLVSPCLPQYLHYQWIKPSSGQRSI